MRYAENEFPANEFYAILPELEAALNFAMKNYKLYDDHGVQKIVEMADRANAIIDQFLGLMAVRYHRYAWFNFPETAHFPPKHGLAKLFPRQPIENTVKLTLKMRELSFLLTGFSDSIPLANELHSLIPLGFPENLEGGMFHTGYSRQIDRGEILIIYYHGGRTIDSTCQLLPMGEISAENIHKEIDYSLQLGTNVAMVLNPYTYRHELRTIGQHLSMLEYPKSSNSP